MGENQYSYLNSIEHFETRKVFTSKSATWKLLDIEGEACDSIPYCNIGVAQLNSQEIAIIGGYRNGQIVGDVHLFNKETGTIENVVSDNQIKLRIDGNQCICVKQNTLLAFGIDCNQ